jgi:hypothetical protein
MQEYDNEDNKDENANDFVAAFKQERNTYVTALVQPTMIVNDGRNCG